LGLHVDFLEGIAQTLGYQLVYIVDSELEVYVVAQKSRLDAVVGKQLDVQTSYTRERQRHKCDVLGVKETQGSVLVEDDVHILHDWDDLLDGRRHLRAFDWYQIPAAVNALVDSEVHFFSGFDQ
jgi:hypothetical protein